MKKIQKRRVSMIKSQKAEPMRKFEAPGVLTLKKERLVDRKKVDDVAFFKCKCVKDYGYRTK